MRENKEADSQLGSRHSSTFLMHNKINNQIVDFQFYEL